MNIPLCRPISTSHGASSKQASRTRADAAPSTVGMHTAVSENLRCCRLHVSSCAFALLEAAVPEVARNPKVFDLKEAEAATTALADLPDELYKVTGVCVVHIALLNQQ